MEEMIDEVKEGSGQSRGRGRPDGGDTRTMVANKRRKRFDINPNFKMPHVPIKDPDPHRTNYKCTMCGTVYSKQKGNFLTTGSVLWKANNGFIPVCKPCCEILMTSFTELYNGNDEHALRHMCSIFDWYYSEVASAMTLSQIHRGGTRMSLYPSKTCVTSVSCNGTSFADTLKDEYEFAAKINSDEDVKSAIEEGENAEDGEFVLSKEVVKRWGKGYSVDEYEYLEDQYHEWCTKNVCNTKSQEEIYKNIAYAQLNIRNAMRSGNKVPEAQKALQDLMSSASILPKQTADNILADTQTFATLLRKYEETDPIPEPDERWRDVDGIRKYTNTWFRGGLAKALKIRNDNTALYEEALSEYERYTVAPQKHDLQQEMNDASIFDEKDTSDD